MCQTEKVVNKKIFQFLRMLIINQSFENIIPSSLGRKIIEGQSAKQKIVSKV